MGEVSYTSVVIAAVSDVSVAASVVAGVVVGVDVSLHFSS